MFFEALAFYLLSLVFIVYCLGIGCIALHRLGIATNNLSDTPNPYLFAFFSITVGLVIIILVTLLLGTLKLLTPVYVLIAAALLFLPLISLGRQTLHGLNIANGKYLLWPAGLLLLSVAFAWKAPGHWDDTSFHLPLIRFYLEQQGIELQEYLRFPLFPQNMNMLMALGYMAGGAAGAQVFATLPWFVITLGLMGVSKWHMKSIIPGIIIALLLAKNIGAFKVGFGFAYVDTGLAMFCLAALLAMIMGIAADRDNSIPLINWLILSGLLAGAAAGTKIFGGVFALTLCSILLVTTRNLYYSLLFGICVLVTGIWWYIRSYVISGDPFHPVAANVFGYFLWNEQDLLGQIGEQNSHGTASSVFSIWTALQNAGIELWSIALIGLFFLKKMPSSIRLMQIAFLLYFCFWFFVTQVERYLAPITAVGTYLSCYLLYRLAILNHGSFSLGKYISRYSAALIVVVALVCTSLTAGEFRRNIKNWEKRLSRTNGYELFMEANQRTTQQGNRLVQLGFENAAYFFSGTTIGDVFGVARYSQFINCNQDGCKPVNSDELVKLLDKFNSTMIIVSTQQYPAFNAQEYISNFDIAFKNDQGILLTRKK